MLRKIFLAFIILFVSANIFAQSGSLKGKVIDEESNEPIPFANVSVQQNGNIVTGGQTDFDGVFHIKPITAGVYDVKVSCIGYGPAQMNKIRINAGTITFQDFKIKATSTLVEEVVIKEYVVPLISKDQTQSGGTVTSEDIQKMPGRSASAVAVTIGGVYSENGEVGSIRGARSDGTVTYVDGVKVIGSSSVPKSSIDQVSVILGGTPAKYGDFTGGVISITTKGPSKETHGSVEFVISPPPYNSYIGEMYVSGPLYSKKVIDRNDSTKFTKTPVIGYTFSCNYTYDKDGYPFYTGNWYAKDDVIEQILNKPLITSADGVAIPTADFLGKESFYNTKKKKNAGANSVNATGKLTYQINKNINITVGGSYVFSKSKMYNIGGSLFNYNNYGENIYNNYRVYGRLTHRFSSNEMNKESSASIIKNAFYMIQADYTYVNSLTQNTQHKDNLFNYGYVGKFDRNWKKTYAFTDTLSGFPLGVYLRDGYMDTLVTYQPGNINPDLARYTSYYYTLYPEGSPLYMNNEFIQQGGGLLNGDFPGSIYNMWGAPGVPYNGYSKSNSSKFTIAAAGSADIKDHEFSFGFDFEQRNSASFSVSPASLWTLARQLTNFHLLQLDKQDPLYITDANGVFQDTVDYHWLYNPEAQTQFDINLRKHLGIPVDGLDWLDIDSYSPSDLSLDYFSPDELLNNGRSYVGYSGYDAHGNKLTQKPSFAEFFTAKDENGNFKREVEPYAPNFAAAYIQDKFSFYDLVFNVGLRVDRFDANQQVLKDPYSFYETYKTKDVNGSMNTANNGQHPSNIGDDFVVYVDNFKQPNTIKGYRDGKDPASVKWFDANGTQVAKPEEIAGTSGIMQPYLVDPNAELSASGFEGYTPQINVMPRVSFSFPISDVALFYAHYDVLTSRPTSNNQCNPLNYMFISTNNEINNANLRSSKTIDYELGFNQKVGNTSSIKISSFYREMRDQIQLQMITGAYPKTYLTYANIDFGTVKGFTFSYDLRQTGNVSFRANYTLQFANGTGSDATTSRSLIANGEPNIRTTIPLNYDQRHAFQIVTDYRFSSGKNYNGPKVFDKDILQNTGLNFTINAGSGSPYSKRDVNTSYLIGSINGSRKPFRTKIDLKLDRDFNLVFGEKEGKKGKNAYLNVYIEISNVLNQKNVLGVYSTTGNPDDDGYLTCAKNQTDIQAQYDEASYRNYYLMMVNSPYHYSNPRTIQIGATLSF